jgi:hypothetical protein
MRRSNSSVSFCSFPELGFRDASSELFQLGSAKYSDSLDAAGNV